MPTQLTHFVEYGVILAYLMMMVGIGFIFRRFNQNVGDFFRSGSQGTWWMVGMSSFMAGISAVTFTGQGGAAFEAGWSILLIYLGGVAGLALQAAVFAPWFRQMRATTFPEVIRARFGPVTQQFYAYLQLVTFTAYAALWLFGLAVFSSSTFGLPILLVIPVLGVVVLFYSTTGGKWAIMAADFVQGLIMMSVTVLLSILCLVKLGGFSGLFSLITEKGLDAEFAFFKSPGAFAKNAYTWQWALAGFAISIVTNCSAQNSIKYFAVKDGREARKAAILSAVMMLAGVIFWFIPPITARLLFEQDVLLSGMPKPSEAAFAIASAKLLPVGMLGMMVVAMFSATLSSMDVGINGNAAIVIKDVLPAIFRLLRRSLPSEKTLLLLGRLSTVFFGVLIIGLASYLARQKGASIFDMIINFGAVVAIPITVPMVLCLLIRRVPPWAALVSIGCAVIPGVISIINRESWSFQERAFWAFAAGTGSFLLTRPFWRTVNADYRVRVDAFFEQMHRPVDFQAEVGAGSDKRQFLLMGRLSLSIAGFVLLLLLVPNPMSGRLCIFALAAVIGTVGAILTVAGQMSKSGNRRDADEGVTGTA